MGLPDISDLDALGGIKVNPNPIVDITTEEDAGDRNEAFADVAAASHTITRAWRSFIPGSPPTDPATNVDDAVWGGTFALRSTNTRNGTGDYTITWPATITDALGIVRNVNIRRAWATADGSTALILTCTVVAANQVRVRIFSTAGTVTDASGVPVITVFTV